MGDGINQVSCMTQDLSQVLTYVAKSTGCGTNFDGSEKSVLVGKCMSSPSSASVEIYQYPTDNCTGEPDQHNTETFEPCITSPMDLQYKYAWASCGGGYNDDDYPIPGPNDDDVNPAPAPAPTQPIPSPTTARPTTARPTFFFGESTLRPTVKPASPTQKPTARPTTARPTFFFGEPTLRPTVKPASPTPKPTPSAPNTDDDGGGSNDDDGGGSSGSPLGVSLLIIATSVLPMIPLLA